MEAPDELLALEENVIFSPKALSLTVPIYDLNFSSQLKF